MKFELEPDNRGASDDTLLDDLRSVAQLLAKNYVTKDEYDDRGRWCSATFQKRFGSWCKAHELAGLRKVRNYDATAEDCVRELERVAKKLGTTTLTKREFRHHGSFSDELICRRCGSWSAALTLAGLGVRCPYPRGIPDEELFENLEHLWEFLGRPPRTTDFVKPLSRYSHDPYTRRFGSFRRALETFVSSFDEEQACHERECHNGTKTASNSVRAPTSRTHRTSRTPSWRMRFLVMRRDKFKCRICGASPAVNPGTILVVDHRLPWTKGGETIMENLQTLCEPCNGGKSNLMMEATSERRT